MKKKIIKRSILSLVALILVFVIVTLECAFIRSEDDTLGGYENVIGSSVSNRNAKVVDIALLGAHDAFTDNINYSSAVNPNEDSIAQNGIVKALGTGLIVKFSKAQIASAKQMLYKGVRYFDVRVTKVDDEYYTHHMLISNTLSTYVKDIVDFLKDHPREYVIFDIQHLITSDNENFNCSKEDYEDLFNYLDDYGLMDYVNYDNCPLENLTYSLVTENKTKGGVILLAKTNDFSYVYSRDGDASYDASRVYKSVRSYWHNKNSESQMIEGMKTEYNFIRQHSEYKKIFRINQAQQTAFITDLSIVRSLFKWSLIGMANNFNATLVSDKERFIKYLEAMPIVMVDYATSSKGNFNTLANTYIGEYNKTL